MSKSESTGRTADGRFANGNGGGPGNPFARRVAALRSAAVEELSAEEIRKLIRALYEMALKGDRVAARLVLSYTLGKPQAKQPDPDRLNVDELAAFREENDTTTTAMLTGPTLQPADEWLAKIRQQWDRGEDPPADDYEPRRPKNPLGDGGPGRPAARKGERPVLGGLDPPVTTAADTIRKIADAVRAAKANQPRPEDK